MDKTFQKLLQTDIDLSSLGVERRTDNEPYFCTPKGASVFGWTGVDGIHFCFVRGFGGMVFAVSPANTFPNYVHIAKLLSSVIDAVTIISNLYLKEYYQRRNRVIANYYFNKENAYDFFADTE